MKINKKWFFSIFCIIFLILLPSLILLVSDISFSIGGNFLFANSINKKLEKIFPNNFFLNFKKADFLYKMGEYNKSLKEYIDFDCNNNGYCSEIYHNIGNIYYKMGEELEDMEKVEYWQKSLGYYSDSLGIKYNEKTQKNYDFVLEKLNELLEKMAKEAKENEQNEENNDNNEENENSQNTQNQNSDEENQSNQENQQQQNRNSQQSQNESFIPKQDSIKIDEFSKEAQNPLSDEEIEEIEENLKNLQEEEKYNIKLNNPNDDRDIMDILRDDFYFDKSENKNDW